MKEQHSRLLLKKLYSFSDVVKEARTWDKMVPYYDKRLRLRAIIRSEITRMCGTSKIKLSKWRADDKKELLKAFR